MADFFSNINNVVQGKIDLANSAQSQVKGVFNTLGSGLSAVNDVKKLINDPLGSLTNSVSSIGKDLGRSLTQTTKSAQTSKDNIRVRLKAQTGQEPQVYGPQTNDNLLKILYETNGLLFPYTPTIDWAQEVDYTTLSLTHANQDFQSYKNTPSVSISVTGEFTVQNQYEGQYMLAVLHYLRTVSKMYFGKQSGATGMAGMPPPVLIFSGYGNYMFNELPVILKSHSYSLPKESDYIDIHTADGLARLPSIITISLKLVVQNTPQKLKDEFDLDKFRTGDLMRNNKTGWI